jgi:hypothetical protein
MLASALRFGRIYPRHIAKMVVLSSKIKREESWAGPSAGARAAENDERSAGASGKEASPRARLAIISRQSHRSGRDWIRYRQRGCDDHDPRL